MTELPGRAWSKPRWRVPRGTFILVPSTRTHHTVPCHTDNPTQSIGLDRRKRPRSIVPSLTCSLGVREQNQGSGPVSNPCPSLIRRGRGRMTPSELPNRQYHPNETVAIANDVTSISCIMDGKCSIPGDGIHKVTAAILPFAATIHHVITMRVYFDAYL